MNQTLSLFDQQSIEDDLPFGPPAWETDESQPTNKLPLLLEVSQAIRQAGGSIWSIDKVATGTQFRFEIGSRQLRVLVPMPGQIAPDDLPEKGSPCHVVKTRTNLEAWLLALA